MIPWLAPTPSGPVVGRVAVPGSKSGTARAYVLAALGDGPSVLDGVLDARDTRLMRAALTGLGVVVDDLAPGRVRVGPPAAFQPAPIDVGLAGTLMRFLPPVAALADGSSRFSGDAEAQARPVFPLLDGLRQLGVRIDHPEGLPFTVHGGGRVPGGPATVDASGSSQFLSGLLLSGARFDAGLELTHQGGAVPSWPYLTMTCAMLRDRGVIVAEPPDPGAARPVWRVQPGPIAARDAVVEPDLVNAATFLAAAAATGGSVTLPWPRQTLQAGDRILEVFAELGALVERGVDEVTITGGALRGCDLDLWEVSELTCVVTALLALADGPGRIRGVAHIRGHETDRLHALETELTGLGGRVRQTGDGLAVEPAGLHGGTFHTWADHRMAHAAAVLGLVVPGVRLDDVGCTTHTSAHSPVLGTGLVGA